MCAQFGTALPSYLNLLFEFFIVFLIVNVKWRKCETILNYDIPVNSVVNKKAMFTWVWVSNSKVFKQLQ
jgi:hypothetical protein